MKTAILIRLEPDQLDALDSLSAKSGQSIAAMVRWCVKTALPVLTQNIEANLKNQSTIDT